MVRMKTETVVELLKGTCFQRAGTIKVLHINFLYVRCKFSVAAHQSLILFPIVVGY